MTPDILAEIYRAAFPSSRPWSADEIVSLIQPPGFVVTAPGGFAIGRSAQGEAELITMAVEPASQGQGVGRSLLSEFERAVGVEKLFLEVAADNIPALALYRGSGWFETGRRKDYYTRLDGQPCDAVTMSKTLQPHSV